MDRETKVRGKRLAIIGTGKMGSALARGVVRLGLVQAEDLTGFDMDGQRLGLLARELGFRPSASNAEAVGAADVVVLAVKPKVIMDVLREIRGAAAGRLVVSIAAGVEIKSIEAALPDTTRVVRAMPNIACSVGEGVTAFAPGRNALSEDISAAREVFQCVGKAFQVEEEVLHAVTGLSGSGPGFVCAALEGLVRGGVEAGLPEGLAKELAVQTAVGTCRTLQETGQTAGSLREAVATPGGTTMAGLGELEKCGVREAFARAVGAATRRSRELAEEG